MNKLMARGAHPTWLPVSEGEVVSVEDFVKAADGMFKIDPEGTIRQIETVREVVNDAKFIERIEAIEESCFDGETPVHIRINAHDAHLFEHIILKEDLPGLIGKDIRAEIWHLRPGMEVLSRSEATGETAYRKVTRVFENSSTDVYWLIYSRKDEVYGPGNIFATGNHPIWVIDKGWVKVEDLNVGDEFLTSDGTHSHFISLNKKSNRVPVYNIEVEDFHTYFVGGLTGLWVHNKHAAVKAKALDRSKNPKANALRGEFGGTAPEVKASPVGCAPRTLTDKARANTCQIIDVVTCRVPQGSRPVFETNAGENLPSS